MHPSAFLSYSWDSEVHKAWVRDLAARLRADGVNTILDQWHTAPGDQLPCFMERAIRENDFVIIVCTPHYKERSDARRGGVGYEGDIMTAEVFTNANHRKFIPVLRRASWGESAPGWLQGKYYVDLSSEPYQEEKYEDLLLTILGQRPSAPPIGAPFSTTRRSPTPKSLRVDEPFEDLRILGVAVDQVSMPRLDGTRGSALYRVPFTLSRRPPAEWAQLFSPNWDHPPRWDSMHRPGIARVEGTTIVLDGTTLEEVQKHHRETLKLALAQTNRQYRELMERRDTLQRQQRDREERHRRDVEQRAKDIKFD
jgi:TIR domain